MKHLFLSINVFRNGFIMLVLIPVISSISFAQISTGGYPEMPDLTGIPEERLLVNIQAPVMDGLIRDDLAAAKEGMPERMGINIPVSISVKNAGLIVKRSGLYETWLARVQCHGAIGLGLYFSKFRLPAGATLFAYSSDKSQVLGAFTGSNNQPDGLFATGVVKGDVILIEYTFPATESGTIPFEISELLYVYKPMVFPGLRTVSGDMSGNCEVNAACSEGDNWRNQIKSVVRILIKNGTASYWCTGTIMNNTSSDFSPLLLTADHCARTGSGNYASAADISRWIFYFEYETPGCEDTFVQDNKSLTGAVKLASSSPRDNNGSDFFLVRLNDRIPANYTPFYAGWDRSGDLSPSGAGIHHPAGDVKKISTYTTPLVNDQWGSIAGTHFRAVWSQTEHGHGVTEGGSSGSPIFDNGGRVIGQLTGGESGCSNLTGPDFYGKFAYSWESNGTHDSTRLKPWLDPLNTGQVSLDGLSVTVGFSVDTSVIAIGRSASFESESTIPVEGWLWHFEGGEPETSTEPNPAGIAYHRTGKFSVKLTITTESGDYSVVKEDLIRVLPVVVYDLQARRFFVVVGKGASVKNHVTVTNALGLVVKASDDFCQEHGRCELDMSGLPAGLYFVTVEAEDYRQTSKLLYPGYQ